MNDPSLMNGRQPRQNMLQPQASLRQFNGAALNNCVQVYAVNVVHNQKKPVLPDHRIAHSYDVRVSGQFGQQLDFPLKEPLKLLSVGQVGVNLLDGDIFFQMRVESLVNRAQPASPDYRQNFILVYAIHGTPHLLTVGGNCQAIYSSSLKYPFKSQTINKKLWPSLEIRVIPSGFILGSSALFSAKYCCPSHSQSLNSVFDLIASGGPAMI